MPALLVLFYLPGYDDHLHLHSFPTRRSSDLACKIRGLMVTVCPSQFATRRTLFHVLVGCGLLMPKVSRLKLPVIWLLVSMLLNRLTKSQIWTLLLDRKSGSAGMPRPISYAVFCLKKKKIILYRT